MEIIPGVKEMYEGISHEKINLLIKKTLVAMKLMI